MNTNYQRDDTCLLYLNNAVEDALSKILRFGFDIDHVDPKPDTANFLRKQVLAWAKHISGEIPGYNNWREIYDFTFEALNTPDAVPGSDATHIGTEADLVAEIQDYYLEHDYALLDKETEKRDLANHDLSLRLTRYRQDILDRFASRYSAANPMPTLLALRFRKIRYTYKLRECLLSQVGYYNGSSELAEDEDDDFEFHMYLIQMKLRRPDRLHIFKAPKAMAHYTTDPTSLLPWNNQYSFSYYYDEFGPQQMPIVGINYIERKLVQVLRLDEDGEKWNGLCTLSNWDPKNPDRVWELYRIKREFVSAEKAGEALSPVLLIVNNLMTFIDSAGLTSVGNLSIVALRARHFLGGNLTLTDCHFRALTLPNIIHLTTHGETRRKVFYTHILGLMWSDTPLRKEDNPFAEESDKRARRALTSGNPIDSDLAHLKDSDVKDPRFAGDRPALLTLKHVRYYPQVVGRKSNLLLTPETAGADYRRKLQHLSEAELDQLFSNIAAYPRAASLADKLEVIVNQAVEAARDWQTRAVENHRPISTGTSGLMLSYSRIFLSNINPEDCKKPDHPTLEQLRLTLLAGLIGFNQQNSYDECMAASHGLTYGGVTLEYKDRVGYRDIIESTDPFVCNMVGKPLIKAMIAIGNQFITNFEEHEATLDPALPSWRPLVAQWFKDTTGLDFPEME